MVSKVRHKGYLFDDSPRGLLELFLVGGGVALVLSTAPAALIALGGASVVLSRTESARTRTRRLTNSLYYLKSRGYVRERTQGGKRRLELTQKGARVARKHLDKRALSAPQRPRSWDGKWRLILFDIAVNERVKRNAFRSFIRRLGAVMLQKSVWVHPFDCAEQVRLLKEYFNFSADELRLVVADSIGDDARLKRHFRL